MTRFKEQFLLARIRMFKDRTAFGELYEAHQSALRRFLATKLPTPADADDALSTTFLRTWNYLTASEVDNLSGLIFTIARGVVAEFYRRNRLTTVPIIDDVHLDERSEKLLDNPDIVLIRDALHKLDSEQEKILTLRFFEGLSVAEIGRRLDKSDAAVRMAIHRSLKKLRSVFTSDL